MQTIIQSIASLAIPALWVWTISALKKQRAEMQALKNGVRATLRSRLVDLHALYVETGAGCPVWVKDEAQDVYDAYHALGGNGTGTHLYEEIIDAKVITHERKYHD